MDRRHFLAGLLGVAGAATIATVLKPVEAAAGMPGTGILDQIDDPIEDGLDLESDEAVVEKVWHRGYPHRGRRHRRGRRRRHWRRVCRRFWHRGRWRRRCRREPVFIWLY